MNLSFYAFGIIFLGLSVACGLFQSFIHFQVGTAMVFLQPFANWFLITSIIYLIGISFLLRYFHYKKYMYAFSSGLIAAALAFCQIAFTYILLILVARELYPFNILLLFLSLGAGILFASSLIFSRAGSRPWLKAAGICMFITNPIIGSVLFWSMMSPSVFLNSIYVKADQWASLISSLIPVFFIMNFRSESGLVAATEEYVGQQKTYEGILSGVGIAAVVLALTLGLKLGHHSIWELDWREKGPVKSKELAKAFEARTYVNSQGNTMDYLLMKPLDYDPNNQYPLVVCLHGGPSAMNQARHVEVPEPAPLLSSEENRKKYPAFLLVPQGPPGFSWGGIPGFPAADSLVFDIIHELEEEYAIDEKRRYVAGGSGGGYGTWYFIGTRPDMFAAAIPFAGAGNPALAQNMIAIPVWAFHGQKDRNVSVRGSRDMVEAISKAGGNPRYTEFPDVGHNVWPHVNDTPGLLDWLFAQKRK